METIGWMAFGLAIGCCLLVMAAGYIMDSDDPNELLRR